MARLTLRAAGTAAGCRHSYLSRMVKEKRLLRGDDGLVDLDEVRALLATSDPAQRRKPVTPAGHSLVTPKQRSPALVTTPADARAAIALVARVLAEEGIASDGPPDLQMARLCEVILKSRDRSLRIDERKKTLVSLSAVRAHISTAFTNFRRAVQRMPSRYVPEMAARLGVEPADLQTELDKMIAATLDEMSAPIVRS